MLNKKIGLFLLPMYISIAKEAKNSFIMWQLNNFFKSLYIERTRYFSNLTKIYSAKYSRMSIDFLTY